jgi:hypothetical protein
MSLFLTTQDKFAIAESLQKPGTAMTVEALGSQAGVLEGKDHNKEVASISLTKFQKMSPGLGHGFDDMRASISSPSSLAKRGEQAVKRNLVAKWIMDTTRQPVPYATDQEFRAGLRDGIVLCYLLNKLKPGTITQVFSRFFPYLLLFMQKIYG